MPTARTRANRKYNEKAYDRISLTVPKGQREVLAAYAKEAGLSVNAFINAAIADRMKGDASGDFGTRGGEPVT